MKPEGSSTFSDDRSQSGFDFTVRFQVFLHLISSSSKDSPYLGLAFMRREGYSTFERAHLCRLCSYIIRKKNCG